MKKIAITLCCSMFFLFSFGQTAEKDAQALVQTYQLDAAQAKKALQIQEIKYKNLQEIQVLKESNPDIYVTKLRNVYEGANASVQMMLTETQAQLFHQKQSDLRLLRAKRMGELKESGVAYKDMDRVLLEEGLY